ncbi:MAG: DUF5034 domain-containing protein [Mediterranea sp.]|jgi:hypothetical protein|nr:DUF5034 domain-containing protein [Mediterranea sp.]
MRPFKFIPLIAVVFITASAFGTCCEEEREDPRVEELPCSLTGLKLYHWNNAGEKPGLVTNHQAPREAYMLEIRLFTQESPDTLLFPHNYEERDKRYYLQDPIAQLRVFASRLPDKGSVDSETKTTEVTDDMRNYPLPLGYNQLKDNTPEGVPIKTVTINVSQIYKALLKPLPAGDYRFSARLTTLGGRTEEQLSDTITLY